MRQSPRNEEYRVDPDRVSGLGKARGQPLRRRSDAAQAIGVERHRRGIGAGALLDLDESDGSTAPGDKIDFAARDARPAREDSPTVEAKPPGSEGFGAAAARFGFVPFQLLPPSSSARA